MKRSKRKMAEHTHSLNNISSEEIAPAIQALALDIYRMKGKLSLLQLNSDITSLFQQGLYLTARNVLHNVSWMKALLQLADLLQPRTRIQLSKRCYIYQRSEFDEGMNCFTEMESVQVDDDPLQIFATLLYNAGQIESKLSNGKESRSYYYAALTMLLPGLQSFICENCCNNESDFTTSWDSIVGETYGHRVIIPIVCTIGRLFYLEGNLNEAIAYFQVALHHVPIVKGMNQIYLGHCLNGLGVLYYHLGSKRVAQSIPHFQRALVLYANNVGPKSTSVATTLNNLGRALVQIADFSVALRCYERALMIRSNYLGAENLNYATTAYNIGQCLQKMGKFDNAISYYQEFLRVARSKYSTNHRDMATALSELGEIYRLKKDFGMAKDLLIESVKIGRISLGRCHPELAMILNRLGNFFAERNELDSALSAYEEGLFIERSNLDRHDSNVITSMKNVGEILRRKGLIKSAIMIYSEILELQKSNYLELSPLEIAESLHVLGELRFQSGEFDVAVEQLKEALAIRRSERFKVTQQ